MDRRLPEQVVARLAVDDVTSCWRWQGYVSRQGYGQVGMGGRVLYVHRVVYELLVGPVGVGLTLDHVEERGCKYRDCANPEHLEPVTQGENARRGQLRRWGWGCSEEFAARVRAIRTAPESHREVAERFGISRHHVSNVRRRKRCAEVPD